MKSPFRHALPTGSGAVILLTLLALFVPPQEAAAQSSQQIQQQIESLLHLPPEQIRARLQAMGFDPSLLDAYLSGSRSFGEEGVSQRAMAALRALSQPAGAGRETEQPDSMREERPAELSDPSLPEPSPMEEEAGLRVFGLRTFARSTDEFKTTATGPVPPGYALGPGDEIVVILTGDVEEHLLLPVTREGFIVVPQAGQVWVNGLTLEELRDRLFTALGRVYSGLGRGPEATTHLQVSLASLRANQVYVTGEVVKPGAYSTNPLASPLNVLYLAGGPLPTGSFRDVQIRRNGQLVQRVDLYDYLRRGHNMAEIRMSSGDVIFVPPAGEQVAVRGAVTRSALYELLEGETLTDALEFAGGLTAPAAMGRVRITRILPPSQRIEPGVDRTVVDVDLAAVLRGQASAPELYDGDEIRVFRVRSEVRKVVTIRGAVWKDCVLERPSRRRQEPAPQPEPEPEPIQPLVPALPLTLVDSLALRGDSARNSRRQERQQTERQAKPKPPPPACTFHFSPGMRAWDLIEAAEGLRPEAYRQRAQIVRVNPADSTLSIVPFSLATGPDGTPLDNPELAEFDAIRVFSRTDFQDSLSVRLSGEVRRPGSGTFQYREGMTLEDLLLEAGGLTPEADLVIEVSRRPGAEDRRQGKLAETIRIPVDESFIISEEGIRFYPGDLDNGDLDGPNASSFLLRPHDQVFVRRVPNLAETERTVRIQGEVAYPGVYALQSKDERLSQLVQRAGGLTSSAFAGGFRLYRNGDLVNIELPDLLRNPGGENDLILLPGDSMVVPEYDPVVLVQGAVNSPAAVLHKEGADLDYYIANAGGYARNADRDHVNVRFANGEGAVRERVLFFTRSPKPGPGSVVNVPLIPERERRDFMQTLTSVAQVAGTLTTLLLVLARF